MESLYSFDEASIYTDTQTKKVICRRGEKPDLPVEKNFQKRFNILAAINGRGEVIYKLLEDRQSKFEVIEFLKYLRHWNSYQPAVVTMDNFNTHRNREVYDFIKENEIYLHFQPTHSPFLNGVEELWRQLRSWISRKLFKTKERLEEAIRSFFVHHSVVNINIVKYLC